MPIRIAKTILMACLGVFALLVCYTHLLDYGGSLPFAEHQAAGAVRGMAPADGSAWDRLPIWLLIGAEAGTGLFLLLGSGQMLAACRCRPADGGPVARRSIQQSFTQAKRLAILGVTLVGLVWFLGSILTGSDWLGQGLPAAWRGPGMALRCYMALLGALIFVCLPEPT